MFCTNCGQQLTENDVFCARCGKPSGGQSSALAPSPATSSRPPRRLVRIMSEKKIAGVCAGVARYFDADVTLVRILWLVLAIMTGVPFIAYLVAWIAMPKEYGPAPAGGSMAAA